MTYPSQSQPVGIYPYPYEPPSIVQTLRPVLFEPNLGVNPVNPILVLDLDDLAKKEKLQQNDAWGKY